MPNKNGKLRILSICTSAGLWDKAWIDAGHEVIAGCELMARKRDLYQKFCGPTEFICHDLADLPSAVRGMNFDLIIGGPSCQSHTKLKSFVDPKFPDLTPLVNDLVDTGVADNYLFENVVPVDVTGAKNIALNAMNFPVYIEKNKPLHQSRKRFFTCSQNLTFPSNIIEGTTNSLMAYAIVIGKVYGAGRAAALQGWPSFAKLDAPSKHIMEALADGVPKGLADAWIKTIERDLCPSTFSTGAYITHEKRTSKSEEKILTAIETLKYSGKKITKTAVAKIVDISREQLSRRYQHLFAA